MNKKIIFILTCMVLIRTVYVSAQSRIDLNQAAQETRLEVKGDRLLVHYNDTTASYPVSKLPDARAWKFVNQQDKYALLGILGVNPDEINTKLNNAFPGTDAAEQLLSKTASEQGGIIISQLEAGAVSPGELDDPDTTVTESNTDKNWLWIMGAAAAGLMAGFTIRSLSSAKKVVPAAVQVEEDITEPEEPISLPSNDPAKAIAAAKEKISKLQADKKTLNAANKQLKADNTKLQEQFNSYKQFHKVYYQNVMKDLVLPFNDAVEKGNIPAASGILLKMGAHFTSITRHELELKQAYDTTNIAAMIRQADPSPAAIETIDSNTSPDRVPQHIRNIKEMMHTFGVAGLDDTVILGYRIKK